MPLFMDLHINSDGEISIDDLIEKHQADLIAQKKFEVQFRGMWVNEDEGMVFCLMEGPNKEACASVHQHAHGDQGCNIVEVNPGDYKRFLSGSRINESDIAETKPGIFDSGYRTLLRFEVIFSLQNPGPEYAKIQQSIKKYKGSLLITPSKAIEAGFRYASEAFRCAEMIKNHIDHKFPGLDYRISIVSGKPVEENHEKFYGYALDVAKKLTRSGSPGYIRTTRLTNELLYQEIGEDLSKLKNVQILSGSDETFLNSLIEVIEKNFRNPGFTASDLVIMLHVSRSQLFRKCRQVTNLTPNFLIKEIRLYEALKELDQNVDQISEIAFKTGFNSPSYFTKVFAERFQILPSDYINNK